MADGLLKLEYSGTTVWIDDLRGMRTGKVYPVSKSTDVTGQDVFQVVVPSSLKVGETYQVSCRVDDTEYANLETILESTGEVTLEYYPRRASTADFSYSVIIQRAEIQHLTPLAWKDVVLDFLITAVN